MSSHSSSTRQPARRQPLLERTVIWDSHCTFCRRSVRLLAAMDWLGEHRFVGSAEPGALDDQRVTAADADRAVQLLTHGGRFEGFDAIRRILLRCPPTAVAAPLLWLPGAHGLGDRIYRSVAERRRCSVGSRPGRGVGRLRPWWVLAVVVLQCLVPLLAAVHGVPSRYGWHMFTGRDTFAVEVLDSRGREIPVSFDRWVVDLRPELDWRPLATAICRDVDAADAVHIFARGQREVVACPP